MDREATLYQILGENIKKTRKSIKVKQKDLGQSISLSRASISNIEAGIHKPSLFTVYEIANALDCKIEEILPTTENYKILAFNIDQKYTDILNSINISKKNLMLMKEILKNND